MEIDKTEGEQMTSMLTVFVHRVPKIEVSLLKTGESGCLSLTEFAEYNQLNLHIRNSDQCRAFITAFAKLAMMLEEAENDTK